MPILFDKLVKKPVFGCQQCGQCLLSQTHYICPMTCPKGLRNGPCGGTVNGACEVLPDQPCVWLNIRDKSYPEEGLHKPLNQELIGSSSLANFIKGADRDTRLPQNFQQHNPDASSRLSKLAGKFLSRNLTITYEIASPKDRSGLKRVEAITQSLQPYIDGINTTTNAGGVPSLHSLETARAVSANGVAPIVQFCGRDQGQEAFIRQVDQALQDGYANILALTGDWNPNTERNRSPEHWFPMDSLQMVDILASKSGFVKMPFVGVASNPYTEPMSVSVARLFSKLRAGAHFTQTQAITEAQIFSRWLDQVRSHHLGRQCRIIASVPLVGKERPYQILKSLPGIYVDQYFQASLARSNDLQKSGINTARKLIEQLVALDIDGLHLMNFGVSIEAVIELVQEVRERFAAKAVSA